VGHDAATLTYTPPTIKVKDHNLHNSVEDITVRREGGDFSFDTPSGFFLNPASDNGCVEDTGDYFCPRAGVEKITMLLNNMNDIVDIDLGASGDKVKQIVKGQDGNDDLTGGEGTQKLVGGEDNDELFGGAGKDILLGGPGIDICIGGPGKDVMKDCEPVPMR